MTGCRVVSFPNLTGTPVVLIDPSGSQLTFIIAFVACLSAQLIPVPAPPPDLFWAKRTLSQN